MNPTNKQTDRQASVTHPARPLAADLGDAALEEGIAAVLHPRGVSLLDVEVTRIAHDVRVARGLLLLRRGLR